MPLKDIAWQVEWWTAPSRPQLLVPKAASCRGVLDLDWSHRLYVGTLHLGPQRWHLSCVHSVQVLQGTDCSVEVVDATVCCVPIYHDAERCWVSTRCRALKLLSSQCSFRNILSVTSLDFWSLLVFAFETLHCLHTHTHVDMIYTYTFNLHVGIYTHALSLAGLGLHVSSLSESMNAIILAGSSGVEPK